MKEKLIDLFEYTFHFNSEMIKIIAENIENIDEKTITLNPCVVFVYDARFFSTKTSSTSTI